jgi:hypothetical protein
MSRSVTYWRSTLRRALRNKPYRRTPFGSSVSRAERATATQGDGSRLASAHGRRQMSSLIYFWRLPLI